MPIINAILEPYSEDLVSYDKFRNLSDLDKGCYLIRQYTRLYQTYAFNIFYLADKIPFSTSTPLITEFNQMLDSFYHYFFTSSKKTDPILNKVLGIVQWLKNHINLPIDVTFNEYVYFYNKRISIDYNDVSYNINRCPVISTLFMQSRLKTLLSGRYVADYTEFAEMYKDVLHEQIFIAEPILYTPTITYIGESSDGVIRLDSNSGLTHFSIDYEKIFNHSDRSLLDMSLICSDGYSNNIDYIVGILGSYNIGYDREDPEHLKIIVSANLKYGNLDFIKSNDSYFLSHDSILHTLREISAIKGLKINEQSYTYKLLSKIDFFKDLKGPGDFISQSDDDFVNINDHGIPPQTILHEALTIESFDDSKKIHQLLGRVLMEDDTPTEEPASDDNIDEASETQTEDNFDDQPSDDDPFGSADFSDDTSSTGSSGSNPNTVKVEENTNINTNSKQGLKLELDTNPTLDSVITKKELVVLINNCLKTDISDNQKRTLMHIKNMWMGLITVRSLIGWVELTLGRNIFKKN